MKNEPMRCFQGTSKPHEPFWTLVDAASSDSGEAEVEFYGPISEYSWWGDEVTPKMFKDDLYRVGKGGPVTVRINSPGGEMIAASVIRSILMDYTGQVTTRIDGLCASAATFVATAGNRVKMQDSALFMIHDPSVLVWGTVDDIKKSLEMIKTVKDSIIEQYQSKTNLPYEKLTKMMSDETWMTAQQALDFGFVDEIISKPSSRTSDIFKNATFVNALTDYRNLPESLRKLLNEQQQETPVVSNPMADRLRAEAKLYI